MGSVSLCVVSVRCEFQFVSAWRACAFVWCVRGECELVCVVREHGECAPVRVCGVCERVSGVYVVTVWCLCDECECVVSVCDVRIGGEFECGPVRVCGVLVCVVYVVSVSLYVVSVGGEYGPVCVCGDRECACVCVCVCGDRECVCVCACVWRALRVRSVRGFGFLWTR